MAQETFDQDTCEQFVQGEFVNPDLRQTILRYQQEANAVLESVYTGKGCDFEIYFSENPECSLQRQNPSNEEVISSYISPNPDEKISLIQFKDNEFFLEQGGFYGFWVKDECNEYPGKIHAGGGVENGGLDIEGMDGDMVEFAVSVGRKTPENIEYPNDIVIHCWNGALKITYGEGKEIEIRENNQIIIATKEDGEIGNYIKSLYLNGELLIRGGVQNDTINGCSIVRQNLSPRNEKMEMQDFILLGLPMLILIIKHVNDVIRKIRMACMHRILGKIKRIEDSAATKKTTKGKQEQSEKKNGNGIEGPNTNAQDQTILKNPSEDAGTSTMPLKPSPKKRTPRQKKTKEHPSSF